MNKAKFYFSILFSLFLSGVMAQGSGSKSLSITCDAEFSAVIDSGMTYTFNHLYQDQSLSYVWNFGDSTVSTSINPQHTFYSAGIHTVCLSIMHPDLNCTDYYCAQITVVDPNAPVIPQIKGVVSKQDSTPLMEGTVIVYHVDPTNIVFTPIDTIEVDSGRYEFYDLEEGIYALRSRISPYDNDYLENAPAYYAIQNKPFDELYWYNTKFVHVNTRETQFVNFNLAKLKTVYGNASISGVLYKNPEMTIPYSGQLVVLLDDSKEPVGTCYTNTNGEFSFSYLPVGKYTVEPEVPGRYTDHQKIYISNPTDNLFGLALFDDGYRISSVLYSSIEEIDESKVSTFPNPAQNTVTINSTELEQLSEKTLTVYDATGREKSVNILNVSGSQLTLDISNLPNGMYIVDIKDFYMPVRFVKFN